LTEASRDFVGELVNTHIYTARETADALGVTTQRLHTLTNKGRIEPIKKDGRTYLYFRKDVEALKEELVANHIKYCKPKGTKR
jgi:predicted site-specific integrase-resolvase